jgi:hypothetical protein
MTAALVDNDVLIKMSAYNTLLPLLQNQPYGADTFAMLGAAQFVVLKNLKKKLDAEPRQLAIHEFEQALKIVTTIEPTNEEIRLAAELELVAKQKNLELDVGESQLCAILIERGETLLFTGDKRATVAIGGIIATGRHTELRGNVVCLEQLFLWLLKVMDGALIRAKVCNRPRTIDTALYMCFGCFSNDTTPESILDGLSSYINDLASKAPDVLLSTDQFFKKTA